MVCCVLPFDKSLMFTVKTTTFGYFTRISDHPIYKSFKFLKYYSIF